ncbi:hypothetical protein GNF10_17340 [Nostoc sp. UCD121]|uniref:hypothetical protein n=1 Tax=unclassified Nostoc TaxID=2593658 RepID=UPI001629CB5B|nr:MULTISPECIES: hypothetical protein [unclassified Nostoc]MBC1218489.1 hypothetical protein [Nostoc sp. UCD120]MBC1277673.1 hypothetical protein [Nostoc sp. UCD121]MBC1296207.1 hypothetical protein [Nostoc sp. UCD122]
MPLYAALPELLLPNGFTHWHDESEVLNGGQIKTDTNAVLAYGCEIYQNPPALNDSFSFKKLLAAGSYNLFVLTVLGLNLGKLKLEIDGNLAFDDMDFYSSPVIYNAMPQRAITIPSDGLHEFKFTVFTKNPASSNYYFSGRKIWARKI